MIYLQPNKKSREPREGDVTLDIFFSRIFFLDLSKWGRSGRMKKSRTVQQARIRCWSFSGLSSRFPRVYMSSSSFVGFICHFLSFVGCNPAFCRAHLTCSSALFSGMHSFLSPPVTPSSTSGGGEGGHKRSKKVSNMQISAVFPGRSLDFHV